MLFRSMDSVRFKLGSGGAPSKRMYETDSIECAGPKMHAIVLLTTTMEHNGASVKLRGF